MTKWQELILLLLLTLSFSGAALAQEKAGLG